MKPLTNRNFNNTNVDELVLHFGMSMKNNDNFFRTIAFNRELGVLLIAYANSNDFFVYTSNYADVTGTHFPVKTIATKQKLAQLISRNVEKWYNFPGAIDLGNELNPVGVHGSNTLVLRYRQSYIFANMTTNGGGVLFDKETLVTVSPVLLNLFSKYLTIPGIVSPQNLLQTNVAINRMNIKGLFNENNRTVLSLLYKNQPLTFNTKNQHLTVPRDNTLGLTNLDRIVLEKYVKEQYVYNPNTRRLVNSSVKSFKPVKSIPALSEAELAVLTDFNRQYNGKRLLVDAQQNTAVFNGNQNALLNNSNNVQYLKLAVTKIIESALPSGSDRRAYWNGNYNVIFRNNVSKDYTLYQDWHRDIDKQYNQSMYAFVLFFVNGDDRFNGGELVCVRPKADTSVNRNNMVTCNPAAGTGQAVVLHAGTGYHKVMPYVQKMNINNKNNGVINRNMILIQLFTNRYMLNEQNLQVGSVKQYANNQMKRKLNNMIQ
jgi:hypothetical protein